MEGPVGPHLFRASQEVAPDVGHLILNSSNLKLDMSDMNMEMSPIWPLQQQRDCQIVASPARSPREQKESHPTMAGVKNPSNQAEVPLDYVPLQDWTPRQVAGWMISCGFEESMIEKFRINDISGDILKDLQFGDLKELGIHSFGQRHCLWNEIRALRANGPTPVPVSNECSNPATPEDGGRSPTVGQRRARRARRSDDIISPGESASIVAIEQLLPKPHHCSKGERCSKWQKQQRKLAQIAKEFPLELEQIGEAGYSPMGTHVRPASEAVPSVVASSDVLGPGPLPTVRLNENVLRVVQTRDPQENVRQFLNFQHIGEPQSDQPSTPPYEMFPPLSLPRNTQAPHDNLRRLPKLTIPSGPQPNALSPTHTAIRQRATPITAMEIKDRSDPIFRLASPASEMDVPLTAIPRGPVARDESQSVPPDMRFGSRIQWSSSRAEQRPLQNPISITRPQTCAPLERSTSRAFAPIERSTSRVSHRRQPSFAMTRVDENMLSPIVDSVDSRDEMTPTVNEVNHAGWMKKRKTKMLRYEWHENHFRLNGTRLAMHRDSVDAAVLESIDVDEYAVACSSLASNKLGAAFKSLKLSGKKKEGDAAAFSFQLVPAAEKKGMLNAATGKTHHFAVKSRDDRIDWMRELMLAKALKQKADGCEINVNGSMIR